MTEKIFTGPMNRQLKDALNYIKNYIIKEKSVNRTIRQKLTGPIIIRILLLKKHFVMLFITNLIK